MLSVRLFSKRLFFFGLSACIMLALFGFSAQPGPESDALSLPLASVLRRLFGLPLADANRLVRKAAHFGAYFLLGGTLFGGFSTVFRAAGQRFRRFFFSETAAVLYALFDELKREKGLTMFIATHDWEYVRAHADRVLVLNRTLRFLGPASAWHAHMEEGAMCQ